MDTLALIMSFFLGIGLAASAGFRVFVPLFAMSLAARFGFDLNPEWAWVGSWAAITTLGAATVFEILAYYIPWVDNILDSIAIPLAGIAGTMLMALSLGDVDSEVLQWGLAIIAGGGTAAAVSGTSAGTRMVSSATTGGLGNFAVATTETAAAGILSATSIIWAPLAFIFVLVLFYFIYRGWSFVKKRRNPKETI